jgi:hypothetical protein
MAKGMSSPFREYKVKLILLDDYKVILRPRVKNTNGLYQPFSEVF